MRYTILSSFERLPYFTIEGFRQISGAESVDDSHARTALHRWVKAGHLIALKKGVYMHRRFYELHRQDSAFKAVVSAILLPQSYLSLEYVLQQHGILTEITYPVTAITHKNTRSLANTLGTFVFRHIQPDLYFGFQIREAYGMLYAQVSVSKALFDYLYLRPLPAELEPRRYNLAEDLRLNLEEFTQDNWEELTGYVLKIGTNRKGGAKMRRVLNNLEVHSWRP